MEVAVEVEVEVEVFQTVPINNFLYRVTFNTKLAGYIQVVTVHTETRYKARLLHKRHAKLGISLGEYLTIEEASEAFKIFESRLAAGEQVFDTTVRERQPRRSRDNRF